MSRALLVIDGAEGLRGHGLALIVNGETLVQRHAIAAPGFWHIAAYEARAAAPARAIVNAVVDDFGSLQAVA